MKINWTYEHKPCAEPPMSRTLKNMVYRTATLIIAEHHPDLDEININHAGTVGDARHKLKKSFHNFKPPRAIDICQMGPFDAEHIQEDRIALQEAFIEATADKAHFAHETDMGKNHLHVQDGPGAGVKP